jgi:hypothetical protein
MDTYVATTTALATSVAGTLFDAILGLFTAILPYAIGMLVFYIGYRFARRAMAGR